MAEKFANKPRLSKLASGILRKLSKVAFTGNYGDLENKPDLSAYATQASQDAQDVEIARAWKTGDQKPENLTPLFSVPFDDDSYWNTTTTNFGNCTCVSKGDGWMEFTIPAGNGNVAYCETAAVPSFAERYLKPFPFMTGERFTALVEFRNVNKISGGEANIYFEGFCAIGWDLFVYPEVLPNTGGSKFAVPIYETSWNLDESVIGILSGMCITVTGSDNSFVGSFELRISVYRESDGIDDSSDYVPYDASSSSHYTHAVDVLLNQMALMCGRMNVVRLHKNISGDDTTVTRYFIDGIGYPLRADEFTETGKTISEWTQYDNGGGRTFQNGTNYRGSDVYLTDLYAQWEPVS